MTDPIQPATDGEVARRLTAVVRAADQHFESVGGSSRHYVVDCLGPALIDAGLAVVDAARIDAERAEKETVQAELRKLRLKMKAFDYMGALQVRAEKAEAERDRLRALIARFQPTLENFAKLAAFEDGARNGGINLGEQGIAARALLGEVKS